MEYFEFFHSTSLPENPVYIRLIWELFKSVRIAYIKYIDETGKFIEKPRFYLDYTGRVYLPVKSSIHDGASGVTTTFKGLEATCAVLARYRPNTTVTELTALINHALESGKAIKKSQRRIEPGSPPSCYDVHVCLSSDLERRPLWTEFNNTAGFIEVPTVNPPVEAVAREKWVVWKPDEVAPIPGHSCISIRNIKDLR